MEELLTGFIAYVMGWIFRDDKYTKKRILVASVFAGLAFFFGHLIIDWIRGRSIDSWNDWKWFMVGALMFSVCVFGIFHTVGFFINKKRSKQNHNETKPQ